MANKASTTVLAAAKALATMAGPERVTVKATTKKPTGPAITRNGAKFTFAWTIGDADYGQGQELYYKINSGKWTKVDDVGKKTVSKVVEITVGQYFPNTSTKISSISFRVRGRRKNYSVETKNKKGVVTKITSYEMSWSEYADKTFNVSVPSTPSLSATLDGTYYNRTLFAWVTNNADAANVKWFTDVVWETMLREDAGNDGAVQTWSGSTSGTGNASGSRNQTEDTAVLANKSQTRFFRVKARGPAGETDWVYKCHVYAQPLQATIKSASVTSTTASGYQCTVSWSANQGNKSNPIDLVTVQRVIATPIANLACPSGASWTDVVTLRDTKGDDAAAFVVDNTLNLDQCLYVRIITQHDPYDTSRAYSAIARAATGSLRPPTNLTVTPGSNNLATVTAENNSAVETSYLVVESRRAGNGWQRAGIIAAGSSSTTITIPAGTGEWAVRTYARADGPSGAYMASSAISWSSAVLPVPPATVTLTNMKGGRVKVAWSWTWAYATGAEISWSDNKDAWSSSSGVQSCEIDRKVDSWYVDGLEQGKMWYFRVKLKNSSDESLWSDRKDINLATAPARPNVTVSDVTIKITDSVTVSWDYNCEDGMTQDYAEVCQATVNGGTITYGKILAHTGSSQAVIIYAETAGWSRGESYNICVRTKSTAGMMSPWSVPTVVNVAAQPVATITSTSLQNVTVVEDEAQGLTRTVLSLTALPLAVTVTGADSGGITTVAVERTEPYHMERPDESVIDGYEGEAIAVLRQSNGTFSITRDSLLGSFDDGAKYRIAASVQDRLGQSDIVYLDFEVHWAHQAQLIEDVDVEIDEDALIAKITVTEPEGAISGDTFDIYRLSADRPELIYEGGVWGETYVDPYPTFYEFGGHRIVFRTADGDYITEDNELAWKDVNAYNDNSLVLVATIVDFDKDSAILTHNMSVSNTWAKDFTETQYLGGSVQGDWNPAVSRTGTVDAVVVVNDDPDLIQTMRRLAVYPGICHVRTPEGSSYAADVQVSENIGYNNAGKFAEFSLSITRVDPESLDGMTLAQWEAQDESEEPGGE